MLTLTDFWPTSVLHEAKNEDAAAWMVSAGEGRLNSHVTTKTAQCVWRGTFLKEHSKLYSLPTAPAGGSCNIVKLVVVTLQPQCCAQFVTVWSS